MHSKESIAEISARLSPHGSPDEFTALYKLRDEQVERLGAQAEISVVDVCRMDRLGRFSIAQNLFERCSNEARQVLLNDHPHVTAAARTALRRMETAGKPGA